MQFGTLETHKIDIFMFGFVDRNSAVSFIRGLIEINLKLNNNNNNRALSMQKLEKLQIRRVLRRNK